MTVLETRPSDAFTNDRKHVFHSWSAQSMINPIVVAGGEGAWFWDDAGRRYLDFSSQLVNVNIGHQHPKLVAAIKEQADRLCTIAPIHANDARSEACSRSRGRKPRPFRLSVISINRGTASFASGPISAIAAVTSAKT